MDFRKGARTVARYGLFLGAFGMYLAEKKYMPQYTTSVSLGMTTFGIAIALAQLMLWNDENAKKNAEVVEEAEAVKSIKPILEKQVWAQMKMVDELQKMKNLLYKKANLLKEYLNKSSNYVYAANLELSGSRPQQVEPPIPSFDFSMAHLKIKNELDRIKNTVYAHDERYSDDTANLELLRLRPQPVEQAILSFNLAMEHLKTRNELDRIKNIVYAHNKKRNQVARRQRNEEPSLILALDDSMKCDVASRNDPPQMRSQLEEFFMKEMGIKDVHLSEVVDGLVQSPQPYNGDQIIPTIDEETESAKGQDGLSDIRKAASEDPPIRDNPVQNVEIEDRVIEGGDSFSEKANDHET